MRVAYHSPAGAASARHDGPGLPEAPEACEGPAASPRRAGRRSSATPTPSPFPYPCVCHRDSASGPAGPEAREAAGGARAGRGPTEQRAGEVMCSVVYAPRGATTAAGLTTSSRCWRRPPPYRTLSRTSSVSPTWPQRGRRCRGVVGSASVPTVPCDRDEKFSVTAWSSWGRWGWAGRLAGFVDRYRAIASCSGR